MSLIRIVKELVLSFSLSNITCINLMVICHLIYKLILGKFQYTFSFNLYCIIVSILFPVFVFIYRRFCLINNTVIHERMYLIALIISLTCFAIYLIILDFYTTRKFSFDKGSAIYDELSAVSWLSFFSSLWVEISRLIIFR